MSKEEQAVLETQMKEVWELVEELAKLSEQLQDAADTALAKLEKGT